MPISQKKLKKIFLGHVGYLHAARYAKITLQKSYNLPTDFTNGFTNRFENLLKFYVKIYKWI